MLRRRFPGAVDRFEDAYDTAPFGRRGRGHLRPHPATRRTRWLWLVPLAAGFLAVLGWVLAHDPGPGLAPSDRGWLEVGLAGLLVLLLSLHRSDSTGRLLRMLGEYAAVALLAVLLVTPAGVQPAPAPASRHPAARARAAVEIAGDTCPSVAQFPAWLACLWNTGQEASRSDPPTTRARRGHALAPSPTPAARVQVGMSQPRSRLDSELAAALQSLERVFGPLQVLEVHPTPPQHHPAGVDAPAGPDQPSLFDPLSPDQEVSR